jgi:hypothetical protein
LDQLLQNWRDVFPQERTFLRARRLLFGLLVAVRVHLTSNASALAISLLPLLSKINPDNLN